MLIKNIHIVLIARFVSFHEYQFVSLAYDASREMENISRGPTFGNFVTIPTEGWMLDNTTTEYKSTDSPPPLY
jgi:hypothetical protein